MINEDAVTILADGDENQGARVRARLADDTAFQEVFQEFASALEALRHWSASQGPAGNVTSDYADLVKERKAELKEMIETDGRFGAHRSDPE